MLRQQLRSSLQNFLFPASSSRPCPPPTFFCPDFRYIPCLLNILGAVLFMRVGYAVGYAGYLGTLAIFAFCNLVAILTALSFSAICTNGTMGGGGVYYMISRSMGPAFGGATGLLFYTCYCINSAFNAVAMCEDIYNTFMYVERKELTQADYIF